ncbi:glycosyltransferase family 4 protein [Aeoliella mucimassa]|uniref:glycosyltransferase family 4 protein n=1 Tax=Aeoliella mucimassa TaxID=2527972 RepID=UPI0018D32A85|nr:glycosyltransferase family 4 protein [Aeoliella mucimassa]
MQPRSGRVLAVAYSCDPYKCMESRVGWQRVMQAARNHRVWVLHGGRTPSDVLSRYAAEQLPDALIEFIAVPNCRLGSAYREQVDLFWPRYRLWQRQAKRYAVELHKQHQFHLIHQINFCSFREPGLTWRLGIPFVWGPIGGTHNLPLRFLTQCDFAGGCREVVRALVNAWQLRMSRRIRGAARTADRVFAASQAAKNDLERCLGVKVQVQLETGIGPAIEHRREPRTSDRPFRLLWAGRQRTWKGLPLLTKALTQLPKSLDYELRVLGVGASHAVWRRQAERLGVADRIQWIGWPEYADTLPHYEWADAFVFTSLRDTSGTGLLESLAAGTPIVGLDHQGAADIMTSDCAEPIRVDTPRQVSSDIAQAISRLADDPDRWQQMSEAAKLRSSQFRWEELADEMEYTYQQILAGDVCWESLPYDESAREPVGSNARRAANRFARSTSPSSS